MPQYRATKMFQNRSLGLVEVGTVLTLSERDAAAHNRVQPGRLVPYIAPNAPPFNASLPGAPSTKDNDDVDPSAGIETEDVLQDKDEGNEQAQPVETPQSSREARKGAGRGRLSSAALRGRRSAKRT